MKTQIKFSINSIDDFLIFFFKNCQFDENIFYLFFSKFAFKLRPIDIQIREGFLFNQDKLSENNIYNIYACLFYFFDFYLSNEKLSIDFIECKEDYNDSYFLIELFFVANKKSYKKYLQKIYHKIPVYARKIFEFDDKLKPEDCFYGFLNLKKCKHCKSLIIEKKIESKFQITKNKIENFIKLKKQK